jgi:hypothetical protein
MDSKHFWGSSMNSSNNRSEQETLAALLTQMQQDTQGDQQQPRMTQQQTDPLRAQMQNARQRQGSPSTGAGDMTPLSQAMMPPGQAGQPMGQQASAKNAFVQGFSSAISSDRPKAGSSKKTTTAAASAAANHERKDTAAENTARGRAASYNAEANTAAASSTGAKAKEPSTANMHPLTNQSDTIQRRIICGDDNKWHIQKTPHQGSHHYDDIPTNECVFSRAIDLRGDIYFYINDLKNTDIGITHLKREVADGKTRWINMAGGQSYALFSTDQGGNAVFIINQLQSNPTKNQTYQMNFDTEGNPVVIALNESGTPKLASNNQHAIDAIQQAKNNCINGYGNEDGNNVEAYYTNKIAATKSLKQKHVLLKQLKHFVTPEKFNELYFSLILNNLPKPKDLNGPFKELYGKDCLLVTIKRAYSDGRKSDPEKIIIQRNSDNSTIGITYQNGITEAVNGTEVLKTVKDGATIYADLGKVYHYVTQANGAQIFYEASDDISIASERMVTDPAVLARLTNVSRKEEDKIITAELPPKDQLYALRTYIQNPTPATDDKTATLIAQAKTAAHAYLCTAMIRDNAADKGEDDADYLSATKTLQTLSTEIIRELHLRAIRELSGADFKNAFPQLQTQLALMGRDIQLIVDENEQPILIDINHNNNRFTSYTLLGSSATTQPRVGTGYIAKPKDKDKPNLYVVAPDNDDEIETCYEMTKQEVTTDNPYSARLQSNFDDVQGNFIYSDTDDNKWFVHKETTHGQQHNLISPLHDTADTLLTANQPTASNTSAPTYRVTLSLDRLSIEPISTNYVVSSKIISAEADSGYDFFEDTRRRAAAPAMSSTMHFEDNEAAPRKSTSASAAPARAGATTASMARDMDEDNFAAENFIPATRQQALDIATAWQNLMTLVKELQTPIVSGDKKDGAELEKAQLEKYKSLLAKVQAASEHIKKLNVPRKSDAITQRLNGILAFQIKNLGQAILNDEAISNTEKLALFNGDNDVLLNGSDLVHWQTSYKLETIPDENARAFAYLTVNDDRDLAPHIESFYEMTLSEKDKTTVPVIDITAEDPTTHLPGSWTEEVGEGKDKTTIVHAFAWVNVSPAATGDYTPESYPQLHHFTHDRDPAQEHWRNAGIDAFDPIGSDENDRHQEAYRKYLGETNQEETLYHETLPQAALGELKLPLRDFQDLLRIGTGLKPGNDSENTDLIDFRGYEVHYLFQKGADNKLSQQPNMIIVSNGLEHHCFSAEYDSASGDYRLTQLHKDRVEVTPPSGHPTSASRDGKNFVADATKRPPRYLTEFMANEPANTRLDPEIEQLVIHAEAFEEMLGLSSGNRDNAVKKLRSLEAENYQALISDLKSEINHLRGLLRRIATAADAPNKGANYHYVAWKLSVLETHYTKLTNIPAPHVELNFTKHIAPFDTENTSLASGMMEDNDDSAKMAFKASRQTHDGKAVNTYFAGKFIKSGGNLCLKSIDFSEHAMNDIAHSGLKTDGARPISRVPGASRAFTLATGYELLLSNVRMPPKLPANATPEQRQNYNNRTSARNHRASKIDMHGGLAYDNHLFQITRNIMLGVDLPIGNTQATMNPHHLYEMIRLFQNVHIGNASLAGHGQEAMITALNGKLNAPDRAMFDLLLNSPVLAQSFATNPNNTAFAAQFDAHLNAVAQQAATEARLKEAKEKRRGEMLRSPISTAASLITALVTKPKEGEEVVNPPPESAAAALEIPPLPHAPTLNQIAASLQTAGRAGLGLDREITKPELKDQPSRSDGRRARAQAMAENREEAEARSDGENQPPNTRERSGSAESSASFFSTVSEHKPEGGAAASGDRTITHITHHGREE